MATLESKNFTQRIIYQELKQPYVIDNHSTLNEKFLIGNIQPPSTGGYPNLTYFCLGRGGHTSVVGANQTILINYNRRLTTHSALFEHIPFVVVPAIRAGGFNDLSVQERSKYRLRKKITVNNALGNPVSYYAYYLKTLTPTNFIINNTVLHAVNGEIDSAEEYIPTANDLNPTPVNDSDIVTTVMNGKHFLISGNFTITLTPNEVSNILEACAIIYGNESYATLSEIGIVSAYDEVYSSPYGDNITYTEARTAQIQVFSDIFQILQPTSTEVSLNFGLKKSIPHPIL